MIYDINTSLQPIVVHYETETSDVEARGLQATDTETGPMKQEAPCVKLSNLEMTWKSMRAVVTLPIKITLSIV